MEGEERKWEERRNGGGREEGIWIYQDIFLQGMIDGYRMERENIRKEQLRKEKEDNSKKKMEKLVTTEVEKMFESLSQVIKEAVTKEVEEVNMMWKKIVSEKDI